MNKGKAEDEEAWRRRMRNEAMSEIATDASSIFCLPPNLKNSKVWKGRTVAQRSLEGLVTFLVCYFPHLTASEAVRYLILAKADLLAAIHLIDCSRGVGDRLCPTSSPTTSIALRCAAISASLPEPTVFAATSLALVSHSPLLNIGRRLSPDGIDRLHKLLKEPFEEQHGGLPDVSPLLAIRRLFSPEGIDRLHKLLKECFKQQLDEMPEPDGMACLSLNHGIKGTCSRIPLKSTATQRYLLLEKIHELYLKAIARLPTDVLRRLHHRGLLKAGHCFGPAGDPVSNIILNTIWYDTAFPPHEVVEVDMISTKCLVRIEYHSFNGLVAFLRKLFPRLSEHDAMVYLFRCNASLSEAVSSATSGGHDISSSYEDANKAAADAACHPHPDAQVEFTMLTCSQLPILQSLQGVGRTLTSCEVEIISSSFSLKSYPGKSVAQVPKLVPEAAKIVAYNRWNFIANQCSIRTRVMAALQRYGEEKGTEYELHVICGMNLKIPENGKHCYMFIQDGAPYAHVNFLARPKGSHSDDTAPSLFFLECSNGEEDLGGLSLCCAVQESSADSGRCFHCEYEGNKIVHPAVGTYRGRETDFEEMACGRRYMTNDELVGFGDIGMEFAGVLMDDSVYFDPAKDSRFVRSMNYLVRRRL